jgi:transposase-like protein
MLMKPTNLDDAIHYFSDLDVSTEYVAALRWPDGFVCPHCGGREFSYVSTRRLWKCKSCKKQSSVKVGTIFEGSALGLDKWLPAIWLAANPDAGVSSYELARALGTTQKSAWFMLHRIREATIPEPVLPSAVTPPGENEDSSHPDAGSELDARRWWVAIALAVFALGVAVGRLTSRFDGSRRRLGEDSSRKSLEAGVFVRRR